MEKNRLRLAPKGVVASLEKHIEHLYGQIVTTQVVSLYDLPIRAISTVQWADELR